MGRKNSKGKRKELTDFSYLLNKDEKENNDDNKIEEKDDKKE
ncbi:hypothetical protein ACJDT4_16655 [Clostridium neuense]|uniref:Uncharacterized protein n=1 Tax=Clostridium neuense TaxID=1728934 RepID=A0ABW8TJQ4_9CLOT